jgi:hypothetical protein
LVELIVHSLDDVEQESTLAVTLAGRHVGVGTRSRLLRRHAPLEV